ncbi:MAG: LysR substrate-binding domain-containing protein [Saezia sp.]
MSSIFSQDNLYIFSLVARYGSLTKAADELGMTTSAVSHAIKRTESHFGVALFIRTTRQVELTEAGYYFYRKATNLLTDFHSIERSLTSIDQGIERKIRICINNLLHTPQHTSALLHNLKTRFPSCQIVVSTEVYNGVWDALLNKNIDIAIGAPETIANGGGIDYLEIGEIHWRFVVSSTHPLAGVPEPIAESTLSSYPTMFIEDTAHNVLKRVGWLLHGQEAIQVPDWETKLQSQLLGTGIGFLPDFLVTKEIEENRLTEKQIKNQRRPSKMLLAIKHDLKGEVTQWIQTAFLQDGILHKLYADLLHTN